MVVYPQSSARDIRCDRLLDEPEPVRGFCLAPPLLRILAGGRERQCSGGGGSLVPCCKSGGCQRSLGNCLPLGDVSREPVRGTNSPEEPRSEASDSPEDVFVSDRNVRTMPEVAGRPSPILGTFSASLSDGQIPQRNRAGRRWILRKVCSSLTTRSRRTRGIPGAGGSRRAVFGGSCGRAVWWHGCRPRCGADSGGG